MNRIEDLYDDAGDKIRFCLSFSGWCAVEVSAWGMENWDENSFGMKAVKIVGSEIAYIGLLVVNLIEMVVRGFFALLTKGIDFLIPKSGLNNGQQRHDCFRNNIYGPLALGTYYSAFAVTFLMAAIIGNFFSQEDSKSLLRSANNYTDSLIGETLPFADAKLF